MARRKTTWTSEGLVFKEIEEAPARRRPREAPVGRKRGYRSEANMDLGRRQSIEELTGGRIGKKS